MAAPRQPVQRQPAGVVSAVGDSLGLQPRASTAGSGSPRVRPASRRPPRPPGRAGGTPRCRSSPVCTRCGVPCRRRHQLARRPSTAPGARRAGSVPAGSSQRVEDVAVGRELARLVDDHRRAPARPPSGPAPARVTSTASSAAAATSDGIRHDDVGGTLPAGCGRGAGPGIRAGAVGGHLDARADRPRRERPSRGCASAAAGRAARPSRGRRRGRRAAGWRPWRPSWRAPGRTARCARRGWGSRCRRRR